MNNFASTFFCKRKTGMNAWQCQWQQDCEERKRDG
jgi:hypothetical protein